MNFEKPEKSEFWKKMKKNCSRYHHFRHVYQNSQSCEVQFLRWGVRQNVFVILRHFLPFYPPNNLENQNFEQIKKTPGGIIILNMIAINQNHIMYDSWDMEHDRHNFLSFWTIFCPFTHTPHSNNPEKNFFEKMKKTLEISSFYTSVP